MFKLNEVRRPSLFQFPVYSMPFVCQPCRVAAFSNERSRGSSNYSSILQCVPSHLVRNVRKWPHHYQYHNTMTLRHDDNTGGKSSKSYCGSACVGDTENGNKNTSLKWLPVLRCMHEQRVELQHTNKAYTLCNFSATDDEHCFEAAVPCMRIYFHHFASRLLYNMDLLLGASHTCKWLSACQSFSSRPTCAHFSATAARRQKE